MLRSEIKNLEEEEEEEEEEGGNRLYHRTLRASSWITAFTSFLTFVNKTCRHSDICVLIFSRGPPSSRSP